MKENGQRVLTFLYQKEEEEMLSEDEFAFGWLYFKIQHILFLKFWMSINMYLEENLEFV